jgi:hypothetical protein
MRRGFAARRSLLLPGRLFVRSRHDDAQLVRRAGNPDTNTASVCMISGGSGALATF